MKLVKVRIYIIQGFLLNINRFDRLGLDLLHHFDSVFDTRFNRREKCTA
jgi:hypothetical protein